MRSLTTAQALGAAWSSSKRLGGRVRPQRRPDPSTRCRSRTAAWPCWAFSDDVAALLQQETASWVLEFRSSLLRLEGSNTPRPGSVPLHGTAEP